MVTIIETPPMQAVGLVGYVETPRGLRSLTTVWAGHLDETVKRRFYKNWYRAKKKCFDKYAARIATVNNTDVKNELERMAKYCSVIRLLAHTQVRKVGLRQKKAHIMEIQINGGDPDEKVAFGKALFEQKIPVDSVFATGDLIDLCGVTKGHGVTGVIKRWGVATLQRKTHRGFRKVACIGAWHPARVRYTVARAGQHGFHHRTEINKKVYLVGKAAVPEKGKVNFNASTPSDLTEKTINPLGGFPHYGVVSEDFVMIKGCVVGVKKRVITLRKSVIPPAQRRVVEEVNLKFIDTSSKIGHGRFQTVKEKEKFLGPMKK